MCNCGIQLFCSTEIAIPVDVNLCLLYMWHNYIIVVCYIITHACSSWLLDIIEYVYQLVFIVKSLKSQLFIIGNIATYVATTMSPFSKAATRSGSFNKLIHKFANLTILFQQYCSSLKFSALHLLVNTIKLSLYDYFWNHFVQHFNSNNIHSFHYIFVLVTSAHVFHLVHFFMFRFS